MCKHTYLLHRTGQKPSMQRMYFYKRMLVRAMLIFLLYNGNAYALQFVLRALLLAKKNAIVYISVLHLSQSSCEIITLCTYICMYISRYVCTLCLQISVLFLIHGSVPDVIFNACFECVRCVQSGPTAQMCL